jgi:hypothetical protein
MHPMKDASLPAPLARDVGHWSAHARMWRLTTARESDGYRAAEWGGRLEQLESLAAARASRTIQEGMTFFRLPGQLRMEATSLDPGSLLLPQKSVESLRFIEHFGEYLEFLGFSSELRARACIVAPAQMSRAIVVPFAEAGGGDGETVICCNLSEIPARVALRTDAETSIDPQPGGLAADDAAPRANDEPRANSIALSLEPADCLVAPRGSILGYVPDARGEPTFWFECLARNSRTLARLP